MEFSLSISKWNLKQLKLAVLQQVSVKDDSNRIMHHRPFAHTVFCIANICTLPDKHAVFQYSHA